MEKYTDGEFERWLTDIRRELHSNAETGFDLRCTKQIVKRELSSMGCSVKECGRGCIYTVISGKKEGKCVLLRADMDALPITEKTDLDFACKSGNMHACGHDMHTAMLIGCAFLLMKSKDEFAGCVKLMFQGAEELLCGCDDAVKSGILEDPSPDFAIFMHVLTGNSLKTGSFIVSGGGVCAPAATFFKTEIYGKSVHASQALEGVNALSIGLRAATLMECVCDICGVDHSQCTVTLGQIVAGTCANAISDRCLIRGCIRSYDEYTIRNVFDKIDVISHKIADIYHGSAQTVKESSAPTLLSDEKLSQKIISALKERFNDENVIDGEILARKSAASGKSISNGSEDFAIISHKIPTVMIGLCAGNVSDGYSVGLHNPKTEFDEKVLTVGAEGYYESALKLLEKY